MSGFESAADAQIEALMKNHALTAQVFVICASNYVDSTCIFWMESNLGPQDSVKEGGGWSSIIHPFCVFLAGPHAGSEEKLVKAEIDLDQMGQVKVWIDSSGHYKRPEVVKFAVDKKPIWSDDVASAEWVVSKHEKHGAQTHRGTSKGDELGGGKANGHVKG